VITPAAITVTGITANNKPYDGTTNATLNTGAAALSGVVSGDAVNLSTAGATGKFASKNVGTGITVTAVGLSLGGAQAADYTLTQPALSANITPAALTVTGITANNKPYDGTTNATLNTGAAALAGVVSGDTVTLSTTGASGTFAGKNAGTGIAVTVSGLSISGAQAYDYTLTQPALSANITPSTLTVTGITANSKVYDGTTAATLNTGSAVLVGVISGDTVTLSTAGATGTFASKNAGTGITVTAAGLSLGGPQAADYTLAQPTATATITARPITVTAVTSTKVYDGTTVAKAVPAITAGSLATGDTANFTEIYNTAAVGTKKTLTPTGSVSDGNNGHNYTVTLVKNATGVIQKATPSVVASDPSGTYTGKAFRATATITGVNGSGSSLEGVGATFTYYVGSKPAGTPLTTAPSKVGTYTVVASFAGSTDYNSAKSAPVTFSILPASSPRLAEGLASQSSPASLSMAIDQIAAANSTASGKKTSQAANVDLLMNDGDWM
jgi:hypothetical protein